MKRIAIPLAVFCLYQVAGAQTPPPKLPLDRVEILGRLALSYSPSYIAYLVKTHGVSFTPSADFISQIKLAGGEGILVDRLSTAEPAPMSDSSNLNDRSIEHMAKCSEQIHNGSAEAAEQECRGAIVESPRSPWPLLVVAKFTSPNPADPGPEDSTETKTTERDELLDRADAIAPDSVAVSMLRGVAPAVDGTPEEGIWPLEVREYRLAEERDMDQESIFRFRQTIADRYAQNEPRPIAPEFIRQVELHPDIASSHEDLAGAYGEARQFQKAEAEFQEAIRLEPDNPEPRMRYAMMEYIAGNREGSLVQLREAARSVCYGVTQHLALADALTDLGHTDEALTELRALVGYHPTDIAVSERLVDFYLKREAWKQAIEELRRSLDVSAQSLMNDAQLVEDRIEDERQLAYTLEDDHQFAAAVEQYRFLLRFRPDDARLHNDFGNVLANQKDVEAAASEYYEAERLDPEQDAAHSNIGVYLAGKKDFSGAISEFQTALKINPTNTTTQLSYGIALGRMGDRKGSMAQFQAAIDEEPKDADLRGNVAFALIQLNDEADAIVRLKETLELRSDSPQAENNLAWIYCTSKDVSLRDPKAALNLARRAVRTSPTPNPAFLDTLAEAELLNGQQTEALATETQAAQLDPDNSELQVRLQYFRDAGAVAKTSIR